MLILLLLKIHISNSSGLDEIGTIWPAGELPISNSYTNMLKKADYTFTFYTDHSLTSNSLIKVQFPIQFQSGLGISSCSSSLGPCSVLINIVTISVSYPLYSPKIYNFTIFAVQNPSSEGGTGNFILSTWQGGNLIDSNSIFGVVGISQALGTLLSATVNIVQNDPTSAGSLSRYEFKFRLYRTLAAWNWIRFTFPSNGYLFASNPTCTSFDINGVMLKGSLVCTITNSMVLLQGISEDVQAYANIGVRISAKNPGNYVSTGTFSIETGKNSTLTVYDAAYNILGIVITPGKISRISLAPSSNITLSTYKQVLYRLSFLPSNPIPQGGYIQIIGTTNFYMNGIYYVEYGLEDLSTQKTVQLTYNPGNYTLSIYSFKKFEPVVISLLILIVNPGTPGVSDPLIIRTLMPDAVTIIDEDTSTAYVYIAPYTSPTSSAVAFPSGSQGTGAGINIQISFTPSFGVPANGWVSFVVPLGFSAVSYLQTCYVKPTYYPEQSAQSCYYSSGVVYIQLFSDSAGVYGQFQAGLSSYVRITSLLSPSESGNYIFDFSTYSASHVLIESGASIGAITASGLSSSIQLVHACMSTPTIFFIQLTPSKGIPQSVDSNILIETGYIEILFPTLSGANNLFGLNLGLLSSNVPCLGVLNIQNLTCTITAQPSTPSTPVYVTVSGFSAIPASTVINLHLAGIKYVSTANSPAITINTYYVYNRVRYNLETSSTTTNQGLAPPSVTSSGSSLTLSDKVVLHTSTLSTGTSFTTTVSSGAVTPYVLISIYQTHDNGYCYNSDVTCNLDGVAYPCTCYSLADLILVYLTATYPSGLHTVQVSGLVNPESVPVVNDDLYYYVVGNKAIAQTLAFSGAIPKLLSSGFVSTQIIPSNTGQGYVFTFYSVVLVPIDYIPQGGSILVTFPPEYSPSSSSPLPSCSTNYLHASVSSVSCTLSSNTFTISSFQTVKAQSNIVIFIRGIKNPSVSISSNFVISTFNAAGRIIDQNPNAGTITFGNAWQTQLLQFLDINVFPSNANASGIYSFTFTPSVYMGAGSLITVQFPLKQFGVLTSAPLCRLSGAVIRFQSCVTSASYLYITSDEDLPYKPLTVSLIGIKNFDTGSSDNFVITTSYDSIILQSTGTGTNNLAAVTTTQASTLKVSNILFYPQNEGEVATYEFYFFPVSGISTSDYVVVKFPSQYDYRVGDDINCWATGLTGYLKCFLLHAYTLAVTNHDAFSCTLCEVSLSISGVNNPAQGTTGEFLIGILNGNTYKELNEYSGTVGIIPAPGYSEILYTIIANTYSRYTQTFGFNVTCNFTIPTTANGGEILVKFPDEHVLQDSYIACRSSPNWASGRPSCNVTGSTIVVYGQTAAYSGNFLLYIDNVPNPLTDVLADYITIEINDGFNRKILARSYPNLDPNRFQYTYPGPLIVVNNGNEFNVRRGTASAFVPITLDYPCALNLTLIPSSNNFIFYPSQIPLHVGDVYNEFRVSIPYNTENTLYVITWSILGELNPLFYTPILKTLFNVVKDTVLNVNVQSIMPIPKGFSSFPVSVVLDGGPNSDLTVHISLPKSVSGIELSSSTLVYSLGAYNLNFTISVSNSIQISSASLLFTISGTNSEAYAIPVSTVPFSIITDTGAPEIIGAGVIHTTRTSALITISANKYCWCYYAYALKGTQPPSFEETKNSGPASFLSTLTSYGHTKIVGQLTVLINITGLTASTRYSIFFWGEDLTNTVSTTYQTIDFDTDQIYQTAQFSIRFLQTHLNDVEIAKASQVIQLYLSLPSSRVLKDNNLTVQTSSIRFHTYPVVSFYLLDDPTTPVYPTPLAMISRLWSLEYKFKSSLNNLDTTYNIKGSEVTMDSCVFSEYPYINNKTSNYQTIGISTTLLEDGYVYATALLSVDDIGYPFAFQVYDGNDAWNRPTLSVSFKATAGVVANLAFNQVLSNSTYFIYLVCANQYPGYPQLSKDSQVIQLQWTTSPSPQKTLFSIEFSCFIYPILALNLILI